MCVCVCVCVYLNHFAVQQKLIQHCKSTIHEETVDWFQLLKPSIYLFSIISSCINFTGTFPCLRELKLGERIFDLYSFVILMSTDSLFQTGKQFAHSGKGLDGAEQ